MNYVDAVASNMLAAFRGFATPMTYVLADKTTIGSVRGFARGVTSDDVFVEAMQQDMVVELDAPHFVSGMGQATPRNLDRIRLPTGTYTVIVWRAAPASGVPIFFKLLVRGGQQ